MAKPREPLPLLAHLPRLEADGATHRRDCECVRCDAGFRPTEHDRAVARQRWQVTKAQQAAAQALDRRRERVRAKRFALVEELIEPPRRTGRLYRAAELPRREKNAVIVRKLLPETIPGLEIERMELPPRAAMGGVPHVLGTREYLTCERGQIELSAGGESFTLDPGDVVVFRGDQRHGYRNTATATTIAYSVIAFAPVGG